MDLKRKLELMKRYDFQDFGNVRGSIEFDMALLRWESSNPEKYLSRILDRIQQMQQLYQGINFTEILAEMGEDDKDDFATLLRTRDALPRLKATANAFVAFVRERQYKISEHDETYLKLDQVLEEMKNADNYQGCRYRDRIVSLENRLQEGKPARTN